MDDNEKDQNIDQNQNKDNDKTLPGAPGVLELQQLAAIQATLAELSGKLTAAEARTATAEHQATIAEIKTKHTVSDDVISLLGITQGMSVADIEAKIEKFKGLIPAEKKEEKEEEKKEKKDFPKSPNTKTDTDTEVQALIKAGKISEALALRLSGK